MYVSGTLKDKTISFYREKVSSFDKDGIDTREAYLSYYGELTFAPWDKDKERKLISHEEKHMNLLEEKIYGLFNFNNKCGTNYIYFNNEINKLVSLIRRFDKRISYALLETLYKSIASSNDRILTLNDFYKLLSYLEDKYQDYDQTSIDSTMYLFIKGYNYDINSVHNYIVRRFGIDKKKIEREETYNLYRLGEFVSPNRLVKVKKSLEMEESNYVLPIYFLLKDDIKAKQFLNLCKSPYLDRDLTIENAGKLGVSENLISLIK